MDCQYISPYKEIIQQTLQQGFITLHFPSPIEKIYRQFHNEQASINFRSRSFVILFLYFVLSTGIIGLLPKGEFNNWLAIYGWVGLIIIGAGVLAHVKKLMPYFEWYVGLGSLIAVALSFAVASIPYIGKSNILSHAGIMYATIIVYGFVGLRFYTACIAGWGGGILGMILTLYLQADIDWLLFHRTYTGSSILGMCLAYVTDHQQRAKFLQSCLLQLAHAESEAKNQQLAILSCEDALTGLANRRYLQDMFRKEWQRAYRQQTPLAVVMIDVDYFKLYNDYYGHQAGDVCLQKIATALKQQTSRSSDLAARYGGEEFLLVLPNLSLVELNHYLARLQLAIFELAIPHVTSPLGDYISLSMGATVAIPHQDLGVDGLIKQADMALYRAKTTGRQRYVIYEQDILTTTYLPEPTRDKTKTRHH
ncbi:diguanylate cyclase [Agitococcus lubricus]|uniref:diguanylate cyclase n=1 Tax=Agitococcus lubricus TaxID=1077255 RepID=A0A2T5IYW1_9GAMM|nr:diguanylate cyclase [Agitococcus lubricus]PTQ89199.1 diguanylate cyclase (GGDEF)-like protein [Agitococcus lubricus]